MKKPAQGSNQRRAFAVSSPGEPGPAAGGSLTVN